jgi:hypothetical protein
MPNDEGREDRELEHVAPPKQMSTIAWLSHNGINMRLSPLSLTSNRYVARAWEFEKRRGDAIRLTDGYSEQTDRELVSSSHEFDAVEREESAEMIGSSPGDENRAVDKVV